MGNFLSNFFDNLDSLRLKYYRFDKNLSLGFKSFFRRIMLFGYRRHFFLLGFMIARKLKNVHMQKFFAVRISKLSEIRQNVLVKYLAKELFLYFTVCFTFFFVVFFVNQMLLLAETILQKRVPVSSVMKLILYCLPVIIAQSAPFATLVGFLMCLGRLVTDNEVLILRASGQHYSLIFKSVLVLGILISVFSFIMNDYFLPLGNLKFKRLQKQIILSNPAIELESNSIKRMNDSTLVIGTVTKDSASDLVMFNSEGKDDQRIIIAKKSDIKKSTNPGILMQLKMNESLVLTLDRMKQRDFDVLKSDKLTLSVFETSIIESSGGLQPREMTSWDLMKHIKIMKKDENVTHRQLNKYNLEFNKKFSIPFGSIFFAILAFPLALVFGRKDGQTLGLIFGIIISVLYWAATIIGQMFGIRGGYSGFWMMWTPNFIIGIIGILLYLKLRRK